MSAGYQTVLWNKFKKQYDAILWIMIVFYLIIFIGYSITSFQVPNFNTIIIRAFGTLAIVLLHVILVIGPLSRLSPRFLPLLYNRRHLGVTMFCMAAIHGILGLIWFHGGSNVNPLTSLFTANVHYNSLTFFPFQTLGFLALLILAAMAFTSHDFWLAFLGPKFWKSMHMMVYLAYSLVILHVALGVIQFEKSPILFIALFGGLITICTLHIMTGFKEVLSDSANKEFMEVEWQYVCDIDDIEEGRAKITIIDRERVAVFKYDGKLSAVHNVCKHQMGPLGEGKIVDGCITCPWHGYQYKAEDGQAPAPFKEKVHTYQLKLIDRKIYINIQALPEGTYVEPVVFLNSINSKNSRPFFIGWSDTNVKSVFSLPKMAALAISGLGLATAFVIANQQKRISTFRINYDNVTEMEGWLSNKPVPSLTIVEGVDKKGGPLYKTILLVDALKKGANETVEKVLQGDSVKYVKLKGFFSNNYAVCGDPKEDCAMICPQCITGTTHFPLMEIENGIFSVQKAQKSLRILPLVRRQPRERIHVSGEIIDPKCYFGAMNPGYGKPHLSCAVRCISGGIMPIIKYKKDGLEHFAILRGESGETINMALIKYIGKPVSLKGKLSHLNNWEILYVDEVTAQD